MSPNDLIYIANFYKNKKAYFREKSLYDIKKRSPSKSKEIENEISIISGENETEYCKMDLLYINKSDIDYSKISDLYFTSFDSFIFYLKNKTIKSKYVDDHSDEILKNIAKKWVLNTIQRFFDNYPNGVIFFQ